MTGYKKFLSPSGLPFHPMHFMCSTCLTAGKITVPRVSESTDQVSHQLCCHQSLSFGPECLRSQAFNSLSKMYSTVYTLSRSSLADPIRRHTANRLADQCQADIPQGIELTEQAFRTINLPKSWEAIDHRGKHTIFRGRKLYSYHCW